MGYIAMDVFCICCVVFLAIIGFLTVKLLVIKAKEKKNPTISEKRTDKKFLKEIEDGFKNREFKMHLQFIVDNKMKRIVSAEALSRWKKSTGELVPPSAYIETMKKSGHIVMLDYYMFEKACIKLSQWKDAPFAELTMSCNLTRITISEKDFVSKIQQIADRYDFERRKLLLEITEDSIENDKDVAMDNIIRAKQLGFRIAVDDLGSGCTSLMSLCKYPIDVVKIDRDIFQKTNEENGRKLFRGIISLAHDLNLSVVCEGVETLAQDRFVTETNCDYIQGWYYSKALPEAEAEAFAKTYMEKTC